MGVSLDAHNTFSCTCPLYLCALTDTAQRRFCAVQTQCSLLHDFRSHLLPPSTPTSLP